MKVSIKLRSAEEPARKAERLARSIATDIVQAGMTSGQQLGTTAELSCRYDAGAAAIRQAVILLEQQGLIELKRGQGGGVSVLRSGAQAAAMVLATHLDHLELSREDVFTARAHIEGIGAQLAAARASLSEALSLRDLARDRPPGEDESTAARTQHIVRHAQRLMELSGNPVLAMFSDALRNVTAGFAADPAHAQAYAATLDESMRYRRDLSDAILSGDGFAARSLCQQWHISTVPNLVRNALRLNGVDDDDSVAMDGQGAWLGRQGLEREMNILRFFFGRKGRTAEALVRLIVREIRVRRLPPDARFGSENDLLSYYGVARPALRQALRLLERHGMVSTRQGKAGGIFVGQGDPATALLAFREHALPLEISGDALREAREAVLEPLVRELVSRTAARGSLDTGAADGEGLAQIAQTAGIHIWALFCRAIETLCVSDESSLSGQPTEPLLSAIRAGDQGLAVRLAKGAFVPG